MNIDKTIVRAVTVLEKIGIAKKDDNGKKYIVRTFRGQISAFGAAITMGSLTSAVAFYSAKGSSDTERFLLMNAIYLLIQPEDDEITKEVQNSLDNPHLLRYVLKYQSDSCLRARIIDAAVALKLAMNVYELPDKEKKEGK